MWQELIVYVIVMLAALYATWRWMPIASRAGVVSHVMSIARSLGVSSEHAKKWQAIASAKSGCGSCGPCKACNTNVKPQA